MLILLALVVFYTVILIMDIVNDVPVLKSTLDSVNYIPAPDIYVATTVNFAIWCAFHYNDGTIEAAKTGTCNQYLTQPQWVSPMRSFAGYFTAMNNLSIADYNANATGLYGINFYIVVSDPQIQKNISALTMTFTAFDPELDPYRGGIDNSKKIEYNDPSFLSAITGMNAYPMTNAQWSMFSYSRNIRETMKLSQWNSIGFPAKYIQQPYLTSSFVATGVAGAGIDVSQAFSGVAVRPQSFIVRTETEFRNHTVFGSLALLGSDQLRPWGLVQNCCCCLSRKIKRQLRESLDVVPLIGMSESHHLQSSKPHDDPVVEDLSFRIEELEKQNHALEFILRDAAFAYSNVTIADGAAMQAAARTIFTTPPQVEEDTEIHVIGSTSTSQPAQIQYTMTPPLAGTSSSGVPLQRPMFLNATHAITNGEPQEIQEDECYENAREENIMTDHNLF
ncbi:11974_t:CDS:10 [Ambispora leptoticha]|uniref:11974_t:CDS:1 n=1 Tax=Ambispora leptoticha TaxID=144679 RepID=A0A9N9AS50_9GLOM|nr:11974_t:CDS:10 [Ambispora leptoticha]